MGGRAWHEADVERLIELLESHTVAQIAEEMDRPESTIYYKIRELKAKGEL